MKFDYEAVAGAISVIEGAINTINTAIEDKVVNTTYVSGNAKDSVENYISTINSCLNPLVPDITSIKSKLDEVRSTYLSVESSINTNLGGGSDGGSAMRGAPSASVSQTHM